MNFFKSRIKKELELNGLESRALRLIESEESMKDTLLKQFLKSNPEVSINDVCLVRKTIPHNVFDDIPYSQVIFFFDLKKHYEIQ